MRSLFSIVALIALMLIGLGELTMAWDFHDEPSSDQLSYSAGEFCGTNPPPSISCPQTRLDECHCYLSDEQDFTAPSVIEAPRRDSTLAKVKPRVAVTLPEFECHQRPLPAAKSLLQRPPQ